MIQLNRIMGLFTKKKREKEAELLKAYEEGKYLRVDEDIDNRRVIKEGYYKKEKEKK